TRDRRRPYSLHRAREKTMAESGAFSAKTFDDWLSLARAELRGKPATGLDWATPEGITVKPLYTAADLEGIAHSGVALGGILPGFPPYLRGPRAPMYANRPLTIRQYSGFSTADDANPLDRQHP